MRPINSTARPAGLALAILCLATPVAAAEQGGSFFDDFESFDAARWYVSDGWANGPHQNCWWSKKEVRVSGGKLEVGFSSTPTGERQYRCGELQTRQSFGPGVYEARLKAPAGSGLDAAFFTYIGPTQHQQHDEIDFEILPKNPSQVHTTTFVNGKSGDGETGNGAELKLPYPADSDFIDYAFDWQPDRIDFYLNRQLVRSITVPREIPVTPQRIFFNLWGSDTLGDWLGRFADPEGAIAMQVDWVAYTAPGDKCQFPESVTCGPRP